MNVAGDTAAQRKARGAFFTPDVVAQAIVRWAVRSASDHVLEPSCGEAAFLIPASRHLAGLSGHDEASGSRLVGVELHEVSSERARRSLAGGSNASEIICSDFFELEAQPEFDAVVGNPPYVRYQGFGGDARARAQERALAQGVRISGLASSWAPFTVHAAGFLVPNGRLGLVLPGEFLNREYAASVRSFLLRRFSRVAIVMFEERVFPGVLEEVILLLAEGSGGTDHFELYDVKDLNALACTDFLEGSSQRWAPAISSARLTAAIADVKASKVLESLVNDGLFVPLSTWGDPRLGIVTGANKFFALPRSAIAEHAFGAEECLRLSPPGSRHIRRLTFSQEMWQEMEEEDARCYLFRPSGDSEALSPGARAYIEAGEKAGIAAAYKCRVRTPWWRVPDLAPPDMFVTYMNHDAIQLCTNAAGVRCLNSLHGLRLREELRSPATLGLLPVAALSSATLLSGEQVGRSFGGGMLQVLPREASRLLVPSPQLLASSSVELEIARSEIDSAVRADRIADAIAIVDSIVLRELTDADLHITRLAHQAMRARRVTRGSTTGV